MALEQFRNIDLTIEHANANNFIPRQFSSEGDISGRTLTVQITENGVPAEITGAILRLVWTNKTTGLAGIEDFKTVDAANGIFEVDYPQFNTRGTVEMAIQIYYKNKVTTTRKFEANVQPINGNFKKIIESQQFYALTTALNEATKANPRTSFNTLTELLNMYPEGATGTYLAKSSDETYHSYIYQDGNWKDLGPYNYFKNRDNLKVISDNFTAKSDDVFMDKVVIGATNNKVTMNTAKGYLTIKIRNIPKKGLLKVNKSNLDQGQFLLTTDSSDNYVNNFDKNYANGTTTNYLIYPENDLIVIDLRYLTNLSSRIQNIYLSFKNVSQSDLVTKLYSAYDVADIFEWSDMSRYLDYKNFGELLNEYQPIERIVFENKSLNGFDSSGKVQMETNNNLKTMQYKNIPKKGYMIIPKVKLSIRQFLVLTSGEKCVANLDYRYSDGTSTIYFIEVTNNELIIDLELLTKHYSSLAVDGFYLTTDKTFYNHYEKIIDQKDIFGFVDFNAASDDIETLVPDKISKMSDKDILVFLDNFLKNDNAYENNQIVKTNKSITEKPIAYVEKNDASLNFTVNKDKYTIAIENVDAQKSGTAKILVLGESTSDNNGTMGGIKNLTDADSKLLISYLGTRTTSGVPNEAFSGWGIGTLRYAQTANEFNNPFYNPANSQFDYAYYLSQTSQAIPDIVFINFGINDVNRYTNKTTSMTDTYDFIISQIKAKNPNCKFVIGLTHSYSRYGNYKNDATRLTIIKRVETLQNYYKNRESENIFMAHYYAVVDPILDRPSKEISGYLIGTDSIHMTSDGYRRGMVNMMYTLIKKII